MQTPPVQSPIASKYEIVGRLGSGASGHVYEAIQHPVRRLVAVKVLDAGQMRSHEHRQRFRREAYVLGRIDHPGVVTLFDYGERDGLYHLVTEFVVGRSLRRVIQGEGSMDRERAVHLVTELLEALHAVHRAGFVHRDVKPANIMVYTDANGSEHIKLLDFGVAAALDDPEQLRDRVGTPRYMAPEQLIPRQATARSDLYAVGAILYELLSGMPAMPGRTLRSMLEGTATLEPMPLDPDLGLPEALEALTRRTLALDPTRRPSDALEMARQLAQAAPGAARDTTGGRLAPGTLRPIPAAPDVTPSPFDTDIWPDEPDVWTDEPESPASLSPVRAPDKLSGAWPAIDLIVDRDPELWPAHVRGGGPLPARIRDRTSSARPLAPEPMPDRDPPAPTAPEATPACGATCDEAWCWHERGFVALLALDAMALAVLAVLAVWCSTGA